MKNLLFVFFFLLLAVSVASENESKFNFGDCPISLLEMTVYPKDSTAAAVVIYEDCYTSYEINMQRGDFDVVTRYVVRIKILTQEGVDEYGNVSIISCLGQKI
ncbi:MAG: hypothetical protein LBQ31_01270 [Bacteroidales bacterium]|jgi:hypothetical protein|nr:hypothetical protein [Bacteroidales bacterium]